MQTPFTAARARNVGARRLQELTPGVAYIQFVDGDCEIRAGWLSRALEFVRQREDVAVVCGRRRERFPERSVYNLMCDIEWDTPIGQVSSCGGDSLMRALAFFDVGGFRDGLIAGEEPELCLRLRARQWKIYRIDEEMTLHDAAIASFRQWWRRTMRGGYAYAEGAYLHGKSPERHWVRETRRIWFWGAIFPMVAVLSAILFGKLFIALLLAYPLKIIRIAIREREHSRAPWQRAYFLMLGKFPEMLGQLKFHATRIFGGSRGLIEYK
jgi:GT2 family glycosyltransferase